MKYLLIAIVNGNMRTVPVLPKPSFLAPAIAGLFFKSLGAGGVLFIYAGFYIVSAILTAFLKTPEELLQEDNTRNRSDKRAMIS